MAYFQIVKAKYPPRLRNIYSMSTFVIALLAAPILSYWYSDYRMFLIVLMFCCISLMFFIISKFINKVFAIGKLEFSNVSLHISLNDFKKEITYLEIKKFKLKVGTGISKTNRGNNTYIVQIVLKNNEIFTLHLTRENYIVGVKQTKYLWNNNNDLFDELNNKKIKWEFSGKIKESDCIMNKT